MLQIRFNHTNHLWEIGYFRYAGGGAVWHCVSATNNHATAQKLLQEATTIKIT